MKLDPTQALSASQFAPQAEKYARAAAFSGGEDLEFGRRTINPQADWQMLDVATGGGHTAFFFSPLVAEVVASDLTTEMLQAAEKVAKEKGLTNIRFESAQAEALPYGDATFDLVTCRVAPHHFSSIPQFLAEARRVLKQGGYFLLIDGLAPGQLPDETEYNNWERLRDPSHVNCLTDQKWRDCLAQAGFEILADEVSRREHGLDDYYDRMDVAPETREILTHQLLETSVRDWLLPKEVEGKLVFSVVLGTYVCQTR